MKRTMIEVWDLFSEVEKQAICLAFERPSNPSKRPPQHVSIGALALFSIASAECAVAYTFADEDLGLPDKYHASRLWEKLFKLVPKGETEL